MFAELCKLLQHSTLQIFYVIQHVNLSFYDYLTFGVVGEVSLVRGCGWNEVNDLLLLTIYAL
jgi:hypothetical protein